MAKKIAEKSKTAAETTAVQNEANQDNEAYIAEVVEVYGRSGAGGDISFCKVLLKDGGQTLIRSVYGPIKVGDMLSLREKVRQAKRLR